MGDGQTWQDVSVSRFINTTYTNTTGKPIYVKITGACTGGDSSAVLYINGAVIDYYVTGNLNGSVGGIVPPGITYMASGSCWNWLLGSPYGWRELR